VGLLPDCRSQQGCREVESASSPCCVAVGVEKARKQTTGPGRLRAAGQG
jgi:hypothetical protein